MPGTTKRKSQLIAAWETKRTRSIGIIYPSNDEGIVLDGNNSGYSSDSSYPYFHDRPLCVWWTSARSPCCFYSQKFKYASLLASSPITRCLLSAPANKPRGRFLLSGTIPLSAHIFYEGLWIVGHLGGAGRRVWELLVRMLGAVFIANGQGRMEKQWSLIKKNLNYCNIILSCYKDPTAKRYNCYKDNR